MNCMDSCQDQLVSWNKLEFGHVGRNIVELQKCLQILELNYEWRHGEGGNI